MDVEEGKKENRSLATFSFKLKEFINNYKSGDIYMVESLPKPMRGKVFKNWKWILNGGIRVVDTSCFLV